jgi:hypothetical protein
MRRPESKRSHGLNYGKWRLTECVPEQAIRAAAAGSRPGSASNGLPPE